MDIAKELRAAQQKADTADTELTQARRDLDAAAGVYDKRRRHAPAGHQTKLARQAWGLALIQWATTLIDRAAAYDELRAQRRTADDGVKDHLFANEKPLIYQESELKP